MEKVILMLGSNLGDREEYLRQATELITLQVGNICSMSNVYKSTPHGYISQSEYLNQALIVETDLQPMELLDVTQGIESQLHRVRSLTERYTDRTIDIDILFIGNEIFSNERLTIPHPRIGEREFVLLPLSQIAPHFKHPQTGLTIEAMLTKMKIFFR